MKNDPYPPSKGWLRSTLRLSTKELQPVEAIKGFLSGGKPNDYEFASIAQHGKKVEAIFRLKPTPNPDIKPPAFITVTEGWANDPRNLEGGKTGTA